MKAPAVALAILALAPTAAAQSAAPLSERYAAAVRGGDARGAVELLRQALADPALSERARVNASVALRVAEAQVAAEDAARRAQPVAPSPVAPRAPSPPAAGAPVVTLTLAPSRRSWVPSAGPVALWSVGAASLAASVALAVARDRALAPCAVQGDRAVCPTQGELDRARDAVPLDAGATAALAVGVTALVAGTAWWLLDGRAVVPTVTAQGAGVTFAGRW